MAYPLIPGYEITGILGEGGMGTVYLAVQKSLGRKVAVKILPPSLAGNESYLMRFRHEAKAAAMIRHPNIVQIYDAGDYNNVYFFIMEYIDGETTGARVARKGKLDEQSTLLIAESVAVALEYAWDRAQLVHRDIKPDNILIDDDGTVKLSDLGLAKTMDRMAPGITVGRAMIGSPHYCAPEQAQGEENIDCCADIYALGATIYHFLTGQPPFADTPGIGAMVKKLTEHFPDVLEINPAVSDNTAWLIEKMLARDKALRQQTWLEVLDDINEAIHERPPLSDPAPAGASTMLRSRRRDKSGIRPARSPGKAGRNQPGRGRGNNNFLLMVVSAVAIITALIIIVLSLVF
jgi:serine/threonine-protein kinase